MIEGKEVGGRWVNVGCVGKKVMWEGGEMGGKWVGIWEVLKG